MSIPESSPRALFPSIASKLVGILVAALVFGLVAIGLTLLQSWKLEGGAAAINDMGSQRMRSYRIGMLLSEYAHTGRTLAQRQAIESELAQFDSVLATIKRGDPSRPLFLPKAPGIAERLAVVESRWRESVVPAVQGALASPTASSPPTAALAGDITRFAASIDDLVHAIEQENAEATSWLRSLQFGLIAVAVVGTVTLIYLMFLLVIRPVTALCAGIQQIQAEDFSARVPVESRDEFGTVAKAFNAMAAHLENLYTTLEATVKDKTRLLEAQNQELSTLYSVTTALGDGNDTEDLCRRFLQQLMKSYGAQAGAVRFNNERAGLSVAVSEGLPAPFVQGETCAHAASCDCGEANRSAEAIAVDLSAPEGTRACATAGFRTVGVFPIRLSGRAIGVFNLFFGRVRSFEERDIRLLEMVGQHLGAALENERLRSAARELAVSEERNHIARELHDSIAQSLAFLNLQAQMLDDSLQRGNVDSARQEVKQMRDGVQECYDDVRELLVHFRARVSDAELAAGLRQATERFEGQTGIATSFEESGEGVEPPPRPRSRFSM